MTEPQIGFDYVMTFGKYKGFTVQKIIEKDPNYMMWVIDNNVLRQKISDSVFEVTHVSTIILQNKNMSEYDEL